LETHTYVCESTICMMKQVKSKNGNQMAGETLYDSLRLATTNTGIDKRTIVLEASTTGIPLIEICSELLLCNNFNDALTCLSFFSLNLLNLLFYASFYWKWPASCHVYVKWPVGQKQLDHSGLNQLPTLVVQTAAFHGTNSRNPYTGGTS